MDLLTFGQYAASGLAEASHSERVWFVPVTGVSARDVRVDYIVRTNGIAFLFAIARSLAGPSDTRMPADIATGISDLWASVHELLLLPSRASDLLEDVVNAMCRGGALSSDQWRRLAECYKECGLAVEVAPGPVTPEMLAHAMACPIPVVREVGMMLVHNVQTENENPAG